MTSDNPSTAPSKPASNVVAFVDPIVAAAARLDASITALEARIAARDALYAPVELTDEQQAAIDAASGQLRDHDANLERLRVEFAPIAEALAKLSAAATAIDAVLRSGAAPSVAQLVDAGRIAAAIVNHADIDGTSLYDAASEVWQYAGLLSGDLVVADDGDVVIAERIAS